MHLCTGCVRFCKPIFALTNSFVSCFILYADLSVFCRLPWTNCFCILCLYPIYISISMWGWGGRLADINYFRIHSSSLVRTRQKACRAILFISWNWGALAVFLMQGEGGRERSFTCTVQLCWEALGETVTWALALAVAALQARLEVVCAELGSIKAVPVAKGIVDSCLRQKKIKLVLFIVLRDCHLFCSAF